MASLGDLTLFISAETDRAQKDIKGLGQEADKVVGKKRDIGFNFDKARNDIKNFKRDIKAAGDAAKVAFKVAKMEGFLDDEIESAETLVRTTKRVGAGLNEARKPGRLLKRTFDGLGTSVVGLVNNVAKLGFALYGIQQIAGVLQSAFSGFFKATIGQNIELREQILKAQTALASTNDVFVDGNKVTDPLKAIEALTGTIEERIDSIRERSLELAGITSSGVIEVFGITAQQIGQVGGSLKDAEDLAISFSAALGTFGVPIQQARQEIGALLRGDIDQNAYLAKALGIDGPAIRKAKASTEGLVAFLQRKLEASVAGQAIAAKNFAGVVSNIADFQELLGQQFGEPLLDPLLAGLNKVFALLASIKTEAFNAAAALGGGLGAAATILAGSTGRKAGEQGISNASVVAVGQGAERAISSIGSSIAKLASDLQSTIANILLQVGDILNKIGRGIAALGSAFVGLNVGIFKSLASTFEALLAVVNFLVPAVENLLKTYAGFLELPLVGFFAELGAQFKLLDALGVTAIAKLALVAGALVASWGAITKAITTAVAVIKVAIAKLAGFVATVFAAAGQAVGVFAARLGAAVPAAEALAVSLQKVSVSATTASAGIAKTSVASNFLTAGLTKAGKAALIFNIKLAVIVGTIALAVKAFGDYNRQQQKQAANDRAKKAYEALSGELGNLTDAATDAQLAQRDLELSIIRAASAAAKADWIKAAAKVDKLQASVKKLKEEAATANFVQAFVFDPAGGARRDSTRLKNATAEKKKAEKEYLDFAAKIKEINDRENLKQEVETRSNQLGKLNERLAKAQLALQRQVTQDRFNAEQELATKQIELARSVEQERILLIENRNRKLIDGEEGASAAALSGLLEYARNRNEAEADADSQRQERVLAIQRLENEIENYKFQIGQKVLELRKQGAKIDKESADYVKAVYDQIQLQRKTSATEDAEKAGKELPAAMAGSARVGNTGRSTGPHIDIRGGNSATVIQDARNLIKAWQSLGVEYIQLSNINRDVKSVTDPDVLADLIKAEMAEHGKRVAKGVFAVDIAVPEGTPIPGATAPSAQQQGAAGHMATMKGSGNKILHLMNPTAASAMGKPDDSALKAAVNQNFTPPDISGIEGAKREVEEVLVSIQDSQARLSAIANDRTLKAAVEQLVPKAAVEQYEDAIIKAKQLAIAIKAGNNIEQAEIVGEIEARRVIAQRELAQFIEKTNALEKVSAEEKAKIITQAEQYVEDTLSGFDAELTKRKEALEIEQNIAAVRALSADIDSSGLSTSKSLLQGNARMGQGQTVDLFAQNRIGAESEIEQRRLELQQQGAFTGDGSEEALAQFQAFSDQKIFDAERQAEMDGMIQRFERLGEISSGVGQAISTAFTQGFADILSGAASVQDVLGNMFKGIADSFMQMATKIIADMIKMMVLKSLLGLFGGGSMPGGVGMGQGNLQGGAAQSGMFGMEKFGALGPNFGLKLAKGGVVTGPTQALIGEGGMNEAVVPLPNGKAIPVDFGKKGKMGGDTNTNITVNVDQSGNAESTTTGDQAGKLGKAIDGAVKRVIMEERRSGGLLHNGRR